MQFKQPWIKAWERPFKNHLTNFSIYKNGSPFVKWLEELEENAILLHAPQIVNGAQTSNSNFGSCKTTHN